MILSPGTLSSTTSCGAFLEDSIKAILISFIEPLRRCPLKMCLWFILRVPKRPMKGAASGTRWFFCPWRTRKNLFPILRGLYLDASSSERAMPDHRNRQQHTVVALLSVACSCRVRSSDCIHICFSDQHSWQACARAPFCHKKRKVVSSVFSLKIST